MIKLLYIFLFLTWDVPLDNGIVEGYRVYYGIELEQTYETTSCWAVIDKQDEQVRWELEVKAYNQSDESEPSNKVTSPPFNLRISRQGILSWHSLPFESYVVWYSYDLVQWELHSIETSNSVDVETENRFYRISIYIENIEACDVELPEFLSVSEEYEEASKYQKEIE